jgi:RNA polymerase sigma factor (sigma-70 family)
MPPPPAEPFATRIFLGPALRAQPDRRLVKLVREGYEAAFEEIVRRYRRPLDRFAAAIVGSRSEDVTQDAFSKALMALRGTTTEIELKPWLYRIVRNTALNEIRDAPPPTEELGETIPGALSAAVEAERREEIGELMERLRALPEPQRAAIVMRELEGLSHEEIAAALGVSGGAARQAIYRARLALRDGLGLLVPLPLLRILFEHGTEAAAGAGGAVAVAGAASAAGGGGAALGGLGAAGALKVGLATVVLAGSVGAGVAMQHDRGGRGPEAAEAAAGPAAGAGRELGSSGGSGAGQDRSGDRSGHGEGERLPADDHRGHGGGGSGEDLDGPSEHVSGPGPSDGSSHSGHGSGRGGRSGPGEGSDEGISGGSDSGHHGSGGPGGEDSGSGGGHGGPGSGSGGGDDVSHGGSSGSGGGDSGPSAPEDDGHGGDSGSGGESTSTTTPLPAPEPLAENSEEGSGGQDSGGGDSGSGSSGPGSGGDGL